MTNLIIICYNIIVTLYINNFIMPKLERGTLKHAFRDEMSQIIHWTLVGAIAIVVGLQISQASAAEVTPINQIFTIFM